MKQFDVMISGKYPLSKTIEAENIDRAFRKVRTEIVSADANWDMYPIFEGEKQVTATFKSDGKSYKVRIWNKDWIRT